MEEQYVGPKTTTMKTTIFLRYLKGICTLLIFFSSTILQAQFYNSVEGNMGITLGPQDSLGNFYYQMNNVFVKVNSSNQSVLWRKQLYVTGFPVVYLTDSDSSGNLIVTTYAGSIYKPPITVQSISSAGILVWTKELSTAEDVVAAAYLYSKDKSIYLGGAGTNIHHSIIKLDASGNLLWSKNYKGISIAGYTAQILEKKNGNLYVVGYGWRQDTTVVTLFEIDPMGSLKWNTCYKFPGIDNGSGDVINAKLNEKDEIVLYISAAITDQSIWPVLMKADSVGGLIWSKKISKVNAQVAFSYGMDMDSDNKIIICNNSFSSTKSTFEVLRFSSDSCKLLGAIESDRIALFSVKAFSPNKLVLSGVARESGRGIIAQLDSNLTGLCDFSVSTALVTDYPLSQIQVSLTAYNFSTTVTSTVGAFFNVGGNRYEACTEIVGAPAVNGHLSGTLQVFPNPARSILYIETEEAVNLQIRNQLSQLVLEQSIEAGKNSVDVNNLPKGIYHVTTVGYNGNRQQMRLAIE